MKEKVSRECGLVRGVWSSALGPGTGPGLRIGKGTNDRYSGASLFSCICWEGLEVLLRMSIIYYIQVNIGRVIIILQTFKFPEILKKKKELI